MKIKNVLLLFSLLLLNLFGLKSQELEEAKKDIIEQRVDFLLDINEEGEADFTTLFEQLEYFFEHPINLNHTSAEELNQLGLLNQIQINALMNHIEKHGKLIRLEELQTVSAFDLESILMIQPFVKIKYAETQNRWSLSEIQSEGKMNFFLRYSRILEEQKGFSSIDPQELEENPNSRYLGSPDKLYSRFKFSFLNKISIGFTSEKDAGEEFFKGSQKQGFDFYSAHLFIRDIGQIKQLALGDFQAQFGQGLTFWSGLAFGRTPSIFSLKRNAPKLRPYTSVQEDLFLRGGGATLEFQDLELTLFYSSKQTDANIISQDTNERETIISSLPENGFHRTPNELDKKNAVLVKYFGGNLSYHKKNFNLGLTAVNNSIQANFQPRTRLSNQFSSLDNENTNFGMDFSYLIKNINLFGELSKSVSGGYAHTLGALMVIDPRLSLGLQHRNFQKDFIPIQSNAIGESTNNTNEEGTFIGIESKLSQSFTLSAYADRFIFPWLRFRSDAPSTGQRLFAQLDYRPNKQLQTYFRFRQREKGRNIASTENKINTVGQETTNNYRLHFSYQITKGLRISSRIEYSSYQLDKENKEDGILIYQDLRFKKLGSPLTFSVRYTMFDTESFNSRIYAYENDVLYAFSIPAFSGRGARFYIISKYHLNRSIDIWLRFAQTSFADRKEIGIGRDEIDGNLRSEIKAQIRIKF